MRADDAIMRGEGTAFAPSLALSVRPITGDLDTPMTTAHMIIGSLTLLGFLAALVLNIRTLATGAVFSWQRGVSFAAATLLLLQYMMGFSLLSSGKSITSVHFLVGLLAIIPVGFEHGYASTRPDARQRTLYTVLANAAAFILILIAYMIGETQGS